MRKLAISAILAASVVVAAPAAAQYHGQRANYGWSNGQGIERQIDEIKRRIDRARDHRAISRQEAQRLRYEANQLDRLADRARRGGLAPREHAYMQARIDRLRQQLRYERWD